MTDPKAFAQIAYGLLPRDVAVSVEQRYPGGLSPADWELLVQLLDTARNALPLGGKALPTDLLSVVSDAVRAHFA